MHIDLSTILWVVGLTLAGGLLTGPGMWSDRWGWKTLDRLSKKRRASTETKTEAPPAERPK